MLVIATQSGWRMGGEKRGWVSVLVEEGQPAASRAFSTRIQSWETELDRFDIERTDDAQRSPPLYLSNDDGRSFTTCLYKRN